MERRGKKPNFIQLQCSSKCGHYVEVIFKESVGNLCWNDDNWAKHFYGFHIRHSVWNRRFSYHSYGFLHPFVVCTLYSCIPLAFQLLAEHSDFNFIQFVFTIYYLSVYCVLTFEGIAVDMVCIPKASHCKWLYRNIQRYKIYIQTHAHSHTFLRAAFFNTLVVSFIRLWLFLFRAFIHSFLLCLCLPACLLACLLAWPVVIFFSFHFVRSFSLSLFWVKCVARYCNTRTKPRSHVLCSCRFATVNADVNM